MSKKSFTMKNGRSVLMKCDGQILRKIIVNKGFVVADLSRMMGYCGDYLNKCCRDNTISEKCVKLLMDYKIFPAMYGVEGFKMDIEPVDRNKASLDVEVEKRLDARNKNDDGMVYIGKPREIKIDYNKACSDRLKKRMDMLNANYAASNVISDAKENLYPDGSDMLSLGLKHFFKGMMREIKNDPEFKELIKQAVKEAYEEL